MAVGYEDSWYVGQVDQKTKEKVRVNLLTKKNGFYHWPSHPDRDNVDPKFIIFPNVKGRKCKQKVPGQPGGRTKQHF